VAARGAGAADFCLESVASPSPRFVRDRPRGDDDVVGLVAFFAAVFLSCLLRPTLSLRLRLAPATFASDDFDSDAAELLVAPRREGLRADALEFDEAADAVDGRAPAAPRVVRMVCVRCVRWSAVGLLPPFSTMICHNLTSLRLQSSRHLRAVRVAERRPECADVFVFEAVFQSII